MVNCIKILHDANGVNCTTNAASERLIEALYSESVLVKVWNIANKALSSVRNPARRVEEEYDSPLIPKAEQTTRPLPGIHR
jgi:hypothetical protein